jgi:hypothetical protein
MDGLAARGQPTHQVASDEAGGSGHGDQRRAISA